MQREDDEEDEIQVFKTTRQPEEKKHSRGESSGVKQLRRKELPVSEDSLAKRLGQRSKSALRERTLERTNTSSTTSKITDAPRRKSIDVIPRSSRNSEAVKVDKNCCGWPCSSDEVVKVEKDCCGWPLSSDGRHNDIQKTSRSTSRQPPTGLYKTKEPRSLGALLTRKLFRQNNIQTISYPAWEEEWALFREQHELEMMQMKEMYMGLQEICQELKRMGSHRDDAFGISSRRQSISEDVDSSGDGTLELGQSKRHGALNFAPKNFHHQSNRRAKSAPRARVNWDSGLTKENRMHGRVPYGIPRYCPTVALFEETVQLERVYLRNFVAALIKYEEDRFPTDNFEFERNSHTLRDVVARVLPHAGFAKNWHIKYGIEAWMSRIVFKEFGKASVSKSEVRGPEDARARRHTSWEEYQRLTLLSPIEAIHPEGKVYCGSFHLFCNRRFDAIQNELKCQEEWPDHLVKVFLEAMKHVWRAHKLALAFDPVASPFNVKASKQFDVKFMESLETPTQIQSDCSSPDIPKVGFLVNPGFIVLDRIIKCQVYLAPDDNSS